MMLYGTIWRLSKSFLWIILSFDGILMRTLVLYVPADQVKYYILGRMLRNLFLPKRRTPALSLPTPPSANSNTTKQKRLTPPLLGIT